jgi:hypothetical protein
LRQRVELVDDIRRAIVSTQSKVGDQKYTQWRNNQIDSIKESSEEKPNIFAILKKKAKMPKEETLFQKMKRSKA